MDLIWVTVSWLKQIFLWSYPFLPWWLPLESHAIFTEPIWHLPNFLQMVRSTKSSLNLMPICTRLNEAQAFHLMGPITNPWISKKIDQNCTRSLSGLESGLDRIFTSNVKSGIDPALLKAFEYKINLTDSHYHCYSLIPPSTTGLSKTDCDPKFTMLWQS